MKSVKRKEEDNNTNTSTSIKLTHTVTQRTPVHAYTSKDKRGYIKLQVRKKITDIGTSGRKKLGVDS